MSVSQSNPSISAETDFGAARAGSAPPGRRSVTGFAQRKKRIGGGGANGIEEGGGGDDSSANASPLLSGIGEDISTSGQGSPASAAMAAAALAANNAAEAKALAVAGLAGPGEGGRGGGGGVGGTELSGNTPVAIISEQVEQAYTPCGGASGREQICALSLFIDIGHTYSLNSSLI